jgi:hypothetical protein
MFAAEADAGEREAHTPADLRAIWCFAMAARGTPNGMFWTMPSPRRR